jgi:hypothetical protein
LAYIQLKTLMPKLTVQDQDFAIDSKGIINVPEEFVDEILRSQPGAERVVGDPYRAPSEPGESKR